MCCIWLLIWIEIGIANLKCNEFYHGDGDEKLRFMKPNSTVLHRIDKYPDTLSTRALYCISVTFLLLCLFKAKLSVQIQTYSIWHLDKTAFGNKIFSEVEQSFLTLQ